MSLGKPVVIKAPYTSFSKYVEKAACETSFRDVAKRFFKKSDVLAVQKFTPTAVRLASWRTQQRRPLRLQVHDSQGQMETRRQTPRQTHRYLGENCSAQKGNTCRKGSGSRFEGMQRRWQRTLRCGHQRSRRRIRCCGS